MPSAIPTRNETVRDRRGFTLIELMVVITIVGFLAGMILPGMARVRMKARSTQCLNKLTQIGVAEAMYSGDNREKLTYAALSGLNTGGELTFDDLLSDYMGGTLTDAEKRANQAPEIKTGLMFRCPADEAPLANWVTEGTRRSYALIGHDMSPKILRPAGKWRPMPNDRTGLGLYWAHGTMGPVSSTFNTDDTIPPHRQAFVLSSYMLDPEKTLLATERISIGNIAGHHNGAKIDNATQHHDSGTTNGARDQNYKDLVNYTYANPKAHHNRGFNYVFADGHAEHLPPAATLGKTNTDLTKQTGMWTMDAKD